MKQKSLILLLLLLFVQISFVQAQGYRRSSNQQMTTDGVGTPQDYTIGKIIVTGTESLDKAVLISISKLKEGEVIRVPGDKLSNAVKELWNQNLFDDVQIYYTPVSEGVIDLELYLRERPRLSKIVIDGGKKSEIKDLDEKHLTGFNGKVVNENLIRSVESKIKAFYYEKGFHNVETYPTERVDTTRTGRSILDVRVVKNSKTRVKKILFQGNNNLTSGQLEKAMKETKARKPYKIFGSKKFIEAKYKEDLNLIIEKYSENGYRDAKITRDTVYDYNDKDVVIEIDIDEGAKYYLGDVVWVGNAIYKTDHLQGIFGVKKGEIYNEKHINERLSGSPAEDDVSSLYMNNGYLFFSANPLITTVKNDTINLAIHITEGEQATINRVTLKGNDRTNDKVAMREIRTKPGDKFSKSELMRTMRELNMLGYFDETQTVPDIQPNMTDGTVDVSFSVVEKPSDQLELSGGFGGGSVVGTVGVTFNNFSLRKLFTSDWGGILPSGDGQKLSIRLQSNGPEYQAYNLSFSEPWLGQDKPRYFTVSFTHSNESIYGYPKDHPDYSGLKLTGGTISLGQRLKWPDDWFQLTSSINIDRYQFDNYQYFVDYPTGTSYTISIKEVISRNSITEPIYPMGGSNIQFGVEATLPYSLMNGKDYTDPNMSDNERYKMNEFHRWNFDAGWYTRLIPGTKLVLHAEMHLGFLGHYNSDLGTSQFSRWKLGGGGMAGYDYIQGVEIVALRGYADNSVVPEGRGEDYYYSGSPFYAKYVIETRYPIVLNQQASIYAMTFFEAGNAWDSFESIQPFNLKRSAGVGLRVFLPIFGMLGFDWGYGFDDVPPVPGLGRANGSQFHFTIGQSMSNIF